MNPDQPRTRHSTSPSWIFFLLPAFLGCVLMLGLTSLSILNHSYVAAEAFQGSDTPPPSGTAATPALSPAPSTGTPAATPTSVWLLADDFVDNRNDWTTSPPSIYLEGGMLHLNNKEANTSYWSVCRTCGPFTDIAYEAMINKIEGPDSQNFGLTFRGSRSGSSDLFYAFKITGDGNYWVSLHRSTGWVNLTPSKPSDAINRGNSKNKLRVVTSGSRIELSINDRPVDSLIDTTFLSGTVGLVVNSGGIHIRPEYVRVWQVPSAPVITATPTARPTATKDPRNVCDLQPGEAGAVFHNTHDFKILVTIGGGDWGTHDYWLEPNQLTTLKFPPGAYTLSLTVGTAHYKFGADRVTFEAGKCLEITGSY